MANALTITALLENIFRAKDRVCREASSFIQSLVVNSGQDGASIGGTVTSFRTAQPTLNTSYTPAMTIPAGDDQTITADTLTIDQVANVRIPLTGETLKQLDNTVGGQKVIDDMFAQAIRKIVNTIEAHCASVLALGASRATGTAGTAPFGTNLNILADARQILLDNGAPLDGDVSVNLNTTAGTRLRQLSNLYKANEAGNDALLRRGELLNLMGMSIKESAGIAAIAAGTGAAYQLNGALAVGATTITVDTGAGTILAGNVVTIGNHKYVVKTALAAGSFTIAAPGIREVVADDTAITVNAAHTPNVAFHRTAAELVMRPPAQPYGGDAALDRMTITDDVTGLVFDVATYRGYGMNMVDLTTFYKAKVWKPEFAAIIQG